MKKFYANINILSRNFSNCSPDDNDNDNDNTFIEHKYRLQMKICIYDLLAIRCYVLYLCMEPIMEASSTLENIRPPVVSRWSRK